MLVQTETTLITESLVTKIGSLVFFFELTSGATMTRIWHLCVAYEWNVIGDGVPLKRYTPEHLFEREDTYC